MTWTVRRLQPADAEAARTLNREAFGFPVGAEPEAASVEQPGKRWFGAFSDNDGEGLAATAVDREFEAWFGGRVLPLAGIANVTVAAEHRNRGVLTPLLTVVLDRARERGACLSTLFPSAPGIYRRFGFEAVTNACRVDVPSTSLAAVPAATGVTLRRAGPKDAETIRQIYDTWAAGRNGPLTRRGVSFPAGDQETLDAFSGVSLVLDGAGEARGYAAWTRGGDGGGAGIEVADLVALDVDAYRSLLRTVGSFGGVTATVRLQTSGAEPLRLLLPSLDWTVVSEELCMLKVLDVPAAITGHRCAPGLDVGLGFTLTGDVLPDLNGSYRIRACGGRLRGERGEADDDRMLSPRGLALLYAGAASCVDLRALGLLAGGDLSADADWDALFGGWPNRVCDTF